MSDAAPPARREVIAWLGAASLLPLVGCAGEGARDSDSDSGGGGSGGGMCRALPEETPGPFPGDGSNGPDVLSMEGVVRSDIRTSIGDQAGTASGVPLQVRLRVVDASRGCTPLVGHAVYLWHATRDGIYSLYGDSRQNYLRGVQVSDADGWVTFITLFPGCYAGRWPHMHLSIYPDLDAIADATKVLITSQIALPAAACDAVYGTVGYAVSAHNREAVSLAGDMAFRDGDDRQIATVTGSLAEGLVATLTLGIG